MSNLRNSVQLIGNVGKDLEVKQTASGNAFARTSIATNETYQNGSGQKVTDTQWHNIIAWGKLAENMGKIVKKGNSVLVKGKLTHNSYEDKNGDTRYSTQIVVNEFMVLNKGEKS